MSWRNLPAHWRYPLSIFLLSRIWCAVWVYAGHMQHPYLTQIKGGYSGVANWWLNPWTTYDSQHFLDIALHGYNAHTAAFFPLYPWLLSLAGDNILAAALWGIVLSNACFAAALVFFYRLTSHEYDEKVARGAVWLMAFSPTAMYFSAVYTESLFLLFFVLTFWHLRHKRWGWLAVSAFLAALTRQVGVLIFLALLIEWWQAERARKAEAKDGSLDHLRTHFEWRSLLPAFAPLAALALWHVVTTAQVGDATRGLASQQEYLREPMAPWTPVLRDIMLLPQSGLSPVLWLHLGATILAIVVVATSWKKQPISYSVMTLGVAVMNFTLGRTVPPYSLPVARYLGTMSPFVQRLAVMTEPFGASRLRRVLAVIIYLTIGAFFAFRFGFKDFVG